MKILLQNLKTGEVDTPEVPCPNVREGYVLISTKSSLISSGTEKMLSNFGQANYLNKARQQPDKVKQVIEKIRTDGFLETIDTVKSKLDNPVPLGYSNSGVVMASGSSKFKVGDRVASNGYHAEITMVPENLCVKIPDEVSFELASFTVVGSIALQGIRILSPNIGETVAVIGLGLVGLLTVQMLLANGCNVIAVDVDQKKCDLAKNYGAKVFNPNYQNIVASIKAVSGNVGVDGVIITASSKSDEIIHNAADICRKRAKIVLVGVVGLNLRREDFYEKELSFQVSASYGPGRYDPQYEQHGVDYPIGFARWTANRNFSAVVELLAKGKLDLSCLITENVDFEDLKERYNGALNEDNIAILINYSAAHNQSSEPVLQNENIGTVAPKISPNLSNFKVSFLGAGNYGGSKLIPNFKKAGFQPSSIVTANGISAFHYGRKFEFKKLSSTEDYVFNEGSVENIVICTRHNLHFQQVLRGIEAKKNIFLEKPLCINASEIKQLKNELNEKSPYSTGQRVLMVGFNRRFSPFSKKIRELIRKKNSKAAINMTINSGFIDPNSWLQDKKIGGGRLIGECCHFIDLMLYLLEDKVVDYKIVHLQHDQISDNVPDTFSILLKFEKGSIATINYFSNGSKSYPKENLEVFCGGSLLRLTNFRKLEGFGWPGFRLMRTWRQDKGHLECVKAFKHSLEGKATDSPSIADMISVSSIAIELTETIMNP